MEKCVYKNISKSEMDHAVKVAENIKADPRKFVKYKESRPIVNIKHMIETSVDLYGENVAYYEKGPSKTYEATTYAQMLDDVYAFGTALIDLGLKDKKIAVIGNNSTKWADSYLAVVCGTGIVVPLDKELSAESLESLIKQSGCSAVIFDKKYEKTFAQIKAKEDNELEILINIKAEEDTEVSLSWTSLRNRGAQLVKQGDRRFLDAKIDRDTMSILLFTSGTTGVSKGVMLSHGNIVEDLMAAPTILEVRSDDVFFSVLPVHHTYECTCGFLMPLYKGAAIAYCEGLKHITKNLAEIKPTIFLGVPALFETLHKKIWQNIRKQNKESLVKAVMKVNAVTKKIGLDLGDIFFKDILAVFGGNMRLMICGGAAIDPAVLNGINSFGIKALQGYGLTECAPLAALNPDTAPNPSSIGVEFPGIKVEIRDANEEGIGEICVKGPNIMLGYYNMPELTAETVVDGWFKTGDLGYMDDQGYVFITGRKKNVIITKNGKNVYPEEVEYKLNLSNIVMESMVFQEEATFKNDDKIAASIVVDMEAVEEFYGKDMEFEQVEKLINEVVEEYNRTAPGYAQIKSVKVRKEPLLKNTSKKIIRFAEENK